MNPTPSIYQQHRRPTRTASAQQRLRAIHDLTQVLVWYGNTTRGYHYVALRSNIHRSRKGYYSLYGNRLRLAVKDSLVVRGGVLAKLRARALESLVATPIHFYGTSGAVVDTRVKYLAGQFFTGHIFPEPEDTGYHNVLDFAKLELPSNLGMLGGYSHSYERR